MPLTDTRVKAAKPRLSDYTLADSNGLYLRVRRTGAKTWITRRMIAGKVHVQTIGVYPDTLLVEARLIAAGKAVGNEPPDKRTVRSLGEQYAQRVLDRRYKDSRPVVRYLDRDVYLLIGSKCVSDVVPADVDRVLQAKLGGSGPVATNMLLTLLKGMFAFGVRTGWAKANPAASFTRNEAGGKQRPRQRVLTDDELRAYVGDADEARRPAAPRQRPQAAASPRRAVPSGYRSTQSASGGRCRRARRSRSANTGITCRRKRSPFCKRSRGVRAAYFPRVIALSRRARCSICAARDARTTTPTTRSTMLVARWRLDSASGVSIRSLSSSCSATRCRRCSPRTTPQSTRMSASPRPKCGARRSRSWSPPIAGHVGVRDEQQAQESATVSRSASRSA